MNFSVLKIVVLFCVFAFSACNNANNQTSNSVFKNFAPSSKEYKNELALKLKSKSEEIHYTFNKLVHQNGNEYLDVQFNGTDFNATGLVLVNNWNKLENIRSTKGQSYAGAELKGLKIDVQESSAGVDFIYQDLEKVVD